jgi:hypothetical protein
MHTWDIRDKGGPPPLEKGCNPPLRSRMRLTGHLKDEFIQRRQYALDQMTLRRFLMIMSSSRPHVDKIRVDNPRGYRYLQYGV